MNFTAGPDIRSVGEQYFSLTTALAAVTSGTVYVNVVWINLL